jgi:hypothetical protein
MNGTNNLSRNGNGARVALRVGVLLLLFSLPAPRVLAGQNGIPSDRFHISVTLGGYFLIGVGYSHWIEKHHALEFTAFPFAFPWEGFPFGVRAGYAWVPSNEVWRAKLGGNITVLVRPGLTGPDRFTPILGVTPGIQYDPESDKSFRGDLWMSYYLKEKVFAPTGVEFFYSWPK